MFSLPFGALQADHISSHTNSKSNYTSAKKKTDKKLINYAKQITQAYKDYDRKISQVWGDHRVLPDSKTDVTYRNNMKQRSVVDYEDGVVSVEIAVKSDEADRRISIEERLAQAIEKTILQPHDERSIIEIAENPEPPESEGLPALLDMIADDNGAPLATNAISNFKYANSRKAKRTIITGRDGKKRVMFTTQFRLVPDHIKRRAEKFRDVVDRNAALHRLPAPLIYAIIETESMFNPRAKSPTPAFGLMQLVPATGARDAYKYLYRKDKVLKEHYLYKPKNNIELGAAYLHLLYFRHFKHIKDHDTRQLVTIAAYNAGTQDIYRAFSGAYKRKHYSSRYSWKSNAMKQINEMKPEQVFEHLRKNLRSGETRRYIKKVRDRMSKYSI